MKHPLINSRSAQQGVVIIEAMIAILIFSVGVLGIVGMQANMVKNTTDSRYRAEASYIAQQMIGTMWSDMDPIANLDNYVGITDITALPNGKQRVEKSSSLTDHSGTIIGGVFTVTVGWTAPGETPAADATTAPCFMTVAHCFSTTTSIAEPS
ncbi:MAG: prepilin-type cleavage/methylation domain-containing protein [Sideroxydans sp.]|nr:prepilin-type cleavage/methylation domain-containing protein [Sideroxydans sp.]